MKRCLRSRQGSLLVLALWSLGLLAVLVIAMASNLRQKMSLLGRLEKRETTLAVAQAGVQYAMAFLNNDLEKNGFDLTHKTKMNRMNNPHRFNEIILPDGVAQVSYQLSVGGVESEKMYGIMDEESKINLNHVDEKVIRSLLGEILKLSGDELDQLSVSIADWRKIGSSELSGFYSDDYYQNLRSPYPVKDADYELLDELLLVRGMSQEIYDVVRSYVTLLGDGRVNVNTASGPVLRALGLDSLVVDKILIARSGADGQEATADDLFFMRPYDVATDVHSIVPLKPEEIAQIEEV